MLLLFFRCCFLFFVFFFFFFLFFSSSPPPPPPPAVLLHHPLWFPMVRVLPRCTYTPAGKSLGQHIDGDSVTVKVTLRLAAHGPGFEDFTCSGSGHHSGHHKGIRLGVCFRPVAFVQDLPWPHLTEAFCSSRSNKTDPANHLV